MDQNIVNVYLTDAGDIACQYIDSHATLKEGARAFQVLSNKSRKLLRFRMELGLMIAGGEVDDAKHLRLQWPRSAREGPAFQCSCG